MSIETTFNDLPWSWNPQKRLTQSLAFVDSVTHDPRYEDSGRGSLQSFRDRALHRYVLPQHVMDMLGSTMLGLRSGEIGEQRDLFFSPHSDAAHTRMMQDFEQNLLGLEPNKSTDGLRWYASNAGTASGTYPIAAVAKSVSIRPDVLGGMLRNDQNDLRSVMLRADKYLFDVHKALSEDDVQIGEVVRLTVLGSAVLENSLAAYAIGLQRNQ